MNGLLVIDKPTGMTSRAAVDRALGWFPKGTRLGHTGTLDPLATGVLVLCVGVATRLTEYIQAMDKVYRAGILLGSISDTDDAAGAIVPGPAAPAPDVEAVRQALQSFVGAIDQVPPAYSAAKVTGRRAYDLARRGREVTLSPRRVRIHGIDVLRYEFPHLDVEVRCGKGTYIRSLARDLGQRLGCGGLIEALRRTRVGPFTAEQAVSLESARSDVRLLPLSLAVSNLPALHLPDSQVEQLRHGQAIPWRGKEEAEEVAIFGTGDELVGIARCQGATLQPVRMLRY